MKYPICIKMGYITISLLAQIVFSLKKEAILLYTTLANLSTNYLVICNVYTDVGGMK